MRAYRVAYDGRHFHGFQRQPDVPTVEGALFDALRSLDVLAPDADAPEGYAAAGRTDAGVSAVAQTVAFAAPDWLRPAAFDAALPDSVRAWAAADVPDDFHATRDARSRTYVYHLHAPPDGIVDDRARAALDALLGEHDFHNLTPDERGPRTVRDLSGSVARDGDYLVVALAAGGFPREFVRRAVSLVRAVGTGDAPVERVRTLLGDEPVDGPRGVPPAPAYPLVLADVAYDVDFAVDAEAAEAAREAFARRRAERRTRARVAAAVLERL